MNDYKFGILDSNAITAQVNSVTRDSPFERINPDEEWAMVNFTVNDVEHAGLVVIDSNQLSANLASINDMLEGRMDKHYIVGDYLHSELSKLLQHQSTASIGD